ncbi:TetR/AcrR family transcriptional regulator [Pseudomonas sp. No.21]|uniref:TetR family transcriptional regulator n=2 Tax=Pseudomonas TaxID=286 RepID=A0A6J4E499_9PSED|nr:TetR family transcriptional regulator [Pseudomonas tohonis]GJN47605.1 TetR family transcriptional regulator [Pseudomonas tohonis]GJN52049.1 TetR family transcriptional regulator [Pseudomonas tohonis]
MLRSPRPEAPGTKAPPRMSKTPQRARDTYHVGNLAPQLLQAAREMLEEVGPTKLSLRAVSERVGVSSTAAYHHYANRAELVGQLAAQGFRELGIALRREDKGNAGLQKLRDASLAYFSFARANPALYQLMFGPELGGDDLSVDYREARDDAFGELKRIIAEILGQAIDSAEVRRAALAGWSYTHGLASLVIHGVLQLPDSTSDARFVDSTLKGFEHLFQIGG